ncbi:MAG TPA: DUF4131 domain-containing protein, partial [Pyrinomonadaceae bacterium]|nr:DUF4131 domain-containing protein [Pyrinomonadaceae bacterium]
MRPHRSLFSQHPFAQLAVAFAGGISAAEYLSIGLVISFVPAAVCSLLVLIFVIKKKTWIAGALLLGALFFAGALLAVLERRAEQARELVRLLDTHEGTPLKLTGVLDGPPEFARDKVYLSLRVEQVAESRGSGRVWLLAPIRSGDQYNSLRLRYGARIEVTTTLDRTGNYRNPGVSTLS